MFHCLMREIYGHARSAGKNNRLKSRTEIEREEVMQSVYMALLVYLAIESHRDIKEREISVKNTIWFAIIAILQKAGMCIFQSIDMTAGAAVLSLLMALLPGVLLLLLSRITRQAIGYGDGLLLLVCGLYLGGKEAGVLFVTGLLILFPISLGLLISGHAKRKTQLPFAPCLLAAYLLWLLLNV